MQRPSTNPKSEIRNPKEARSPKSELDTGLHPIDLESAFWSWGEGAPTEALVLREDGSGNRPPAPALQERTARFGERIIEFAKKIPQNSVNNRLISQLVGAGTSVGANYCEADDAVSKKDFKNKIGTCLKEARETKLWLRLIAAAEPSTKIEARKLWQQAKELHLIFAAIWRKA